ncbi:MAG: type II secretion system F family protein [Anaerohalosphaera sp.]|nr:type II secretion system F family protein [Anaerohalosphaera sp.]
MNKTRSQVYSNLANLIDAGLPLSRCLAVAASTVRGRFAKSIRDMGEGVLGGGSLTELTKQHPFLFPELDRVAIEAGELSGDLPACLRHLSNWYTFLYKTRSAIAAGLVLPFMLFHIMILIKRAPHMLLGKITFGEYCAYALSRMVMLYAVTILIVLVIKFSKNFDSILSKIPFCWWMIKRVAMYRYCQVFYLLFVGGIPIARCAETAADMSCSEHFKQLVAGGTENAKRGLPLYEGFSEKLDSEFVDSWRIGEESGELDSMLENLIEKNRFTLERMFDAIAMWVPKIVYVIVSIMIIMAIFELAGGV